MTYNSKEFQAIRQKNINKVLQSNPNTPNSSGVYILTREENGFKYAYCGQATKSILYRLADHLKGYQHIDLSIKKRGLYSPDNPLGWKISFKKCRPSECDNLEQEYILKAHQNSYQLYNHTTGSQDGDKRSLGENNRKGYKKGVEFGYRKAQKEIANLFEKHLNVSVKKEGNKNQLKALEKFKTFIKMEEE